MTIAEIKSTVEVYFGLPEGTIDVDTRKREVVEARQIAMYLAKKFVEHKKSQFRENEKQKSRMIRNYVPKSYEREHWNWSLLKIGKNMGNRDHATVMHSCKAVNNLIDTVHSYRKDIEILTKKVMNGVEITEKERIDSVVTSLIRLIKKRDIEIDKLKLNGLN